MSEELPDLGSRLALRPKEAADALGIGERTLRTWMRDEELPFLRVAGVVLVPTAGLEEWLVESALWGCLTWYEAALTRTGVEDEQ